MNERAEGDIYSTHTGPCHCVKTQSEITLENPVMGNEAMNETVAVGMESRERGGYWGKERSQEEQLSFSPEKRCCSQNILQKWELILNALRDSCDSWNGSSR